MLIIHEIKIEAAGCESRAQNTKGGNHSYWEKFHEKSDKKQITFFSTPVTKFEKVLTLGNCDGACFSKVASCNLGLLHFLKQWGKVLGQSCSKLSGNRNIND